MKRGDNMAGLREEKARKTRAKLVAVARRLFAKNGFAATSTEEILDKAGVTRGVCQGLDSAMIFETAAIEGHLANPSRDCALGN